MAEAVIYDCFPFFNELDLLEIRLHELDGVVDRFVLAEAPFTHSGKPKPLYFSENKDRFSRFLGRIIHIVVDDFPKVDFSKPGAAWDYERHQRDALARGLSDCKDSDLIITGDADEIPRAEAVRGYIPSMGFIGLRQSTHAYWLNQVNRDKDLAFCNPKIYMHGFTQGMSHCQIRYLVTKSIQNGGWHFSFLGDVKTIVTKIEAWAHQEYNRDEWKDEKNIRNLMEKGIDPHGSDARYHVEALDETYPRYVLENREKFKRLIRDVPAVSDASGGPAKPALAAPHDILGKWNYGTTPSFPYGDETSYRKAMEFLDGPYIIEDWGCGTAWARKFVARGRYIGIDGSWSMHCDTVADLRKYKSAADAILLRHILDHNYEWEKILKNALESYLKKLCLILFTPFSDKTQQIGELSWGVIPDISFRKEDLLEHLRGHSFTEESIQSATQYGVEHLFYLRRG